MGIALLTSKKSKDPDTQVGCCIVDKDNKVSSTGYNGFIKGIDDNKYSWSRESSTNGCKYDFTVHSELNAILNSGDRSLKDATVYCTLRPCLECTKSLIQAGISKIYFLNEYCNGNYKFDLAKKLLDDLGIPIIKYEFSENFKNALEEIKCLVI